MAGDVANLFTKGDLVVQSPWESLVVFIFVIMLSILLEKLIHHFHHHKNKYTKAIYEHMSAEITHLGAVAILAAFLMSSAASAMPKYWLTLFDWAHMTLFMMMIFFLLFVGIASSRVTSVLHDMCAEEIPFQNLTSASYSKRMYGMAKCVFDKEVTAIESKHQQHHHHHQSPSGSKHHLKEESPPDSSHQEDDYPHGRLPVVKAFGPYMKFRAKTILLQFCNFTSSAWIGLTSAGVMNCMRLYLLPGQLQSKPVEEITDTERGLNVLSFIMINGVMPAILFVCTTWFLQKGLLEYLKSPMTASEMSLRHASIKVNDEFVVCVPTAALERALSDPHTLRDPACRSFYGSLSLTIYFVQIPLVLLMYYTAVFILGSVYDITKNLDYSWWVLLPLAITPHCVVLYCIPYVVIVLTALTSMGCRLDRETLAIIREAKTVEEAEKLPWQDFHHGHFVFGAPLNPTAAEEKFLKHLQKAHAHGHGGHGEEGDHHESKEHSHHGDSHTPPQHGNDHHALAPLTELEELLRHIEGTLKNCVKHRGGHHTSPRSAHSTNMFSSPPPHNHSHHHHHQHHHLQHHVDVTSNPLFGEDDDAAGGLGGTHHLYGEESPHVYTSNPHNTSFQHHHHHHHHHSATSTSPHTGSSHHLLSKERNISLDML
eukprot:PhF_6_TR20492/c0_g1_i2/m.29513